MRIHNLQSNKLMGKGLQASLQTMRSKRKFDVVKYVERKCILLNKYMKNFNLSSCIVAVSGGIDSAVVLGIVKKASSYKKSPIKKIIAVLLPIFSDGATNQKTATSLGKKVADYFDVKHFSIDLTQTHALLKKTVDKKLSILGNPWANGQLVAYIRTPALYYIISLFSQENYPAILCGTTNRDEGAYLGFFGKASDGMVDVQLISDIHKSEVRKVADFLGVPKEVRNAIPSGDMFDSRSDEQVFGTTYDFVELYMLYLCLSKMEKNNLEEKWNKKEKEQFYVLSRRLEKLHDYNKHKYLGSSSSIHLDVCKRTVPGGWA